MNSSFLRQLWKPNFFRIFNKTSIQFSSKRPITFSIKNIFITCPISRKLLINTSASYCSIAEDSELVRKQEENLPRKNEELIKTLENYGFNDERITSMLKSLPELLEASAKQIEPTLGFWSSCQFGDEKLTILLVENPGLICVPIENLQILYPSLRKIFSKNEMYKLFLNTPQICEEKIHKIKDKVCYLENEMKLSKNKIVNSTILAYPLYQIKERHTFLSMVGIYKECDKTNALSNINPPVRDIITTTDRYFAKKVAKVSLFEFRVFQELFKEGLVDLE